MEIAANLQPENSKELIKNRIVNYWSQRSEAFAGQRKQELECDMAGSWLLEIEKYIPADRTLKILDVGTGTGFFAILLAKMGHQTTGIDLTPSMIEEAGKLAQDQQVDAEFFVMDAEHLKFEDETFDVVISRNLTWTLPHPYEAYQEWKRVLKQGGVLLNFDADYGKEKTADFKDLPDNHTHKQIGDVLLRECDAIKAQLDISQCNRPIWDIHTLLNLGMKEIRIDTGVSNRIYIRKDSLYNPSPVFALCAVKS